uniref:SAM domain-containing protein n=1 Tax=Megaselia scalaris TaxID=36166 RepID=T1GHV3_MEGSC
MDLGVNPINGIASNVVNNKDQASTPLSTKTNNYINCDGNQNDDLDGKENSTKLKAENERLSTEIIRLRKLLENSPDGAIGGIGVDLSDSNSYDAHSTDGSGSRLDRLENELKSARNQIAQLKIERKKLKSDKNDLLAQVKQLCSSLQDKEQELRDFIRNYEQRIRETETNNVKMSTEREREPGDFTWNPITEEGYAEKLRLLREASQVPMERWRASQVLAWLDVALGMPQYSSRCSENIKSGKVLLELNDVELETGIGLVHPMHKKKMRLAIEEQRRPDLIRYPSIGQLGHTWVVSEWLPDIGLPQYAENFLNSMVDARMLDTLSKKELEKYLGVTRKFHQASIVHDSGVHGGLVVLEPSFSGDTMASALGIPQSKSIIRRHLTTEFDALILPARATLGQGIRSGTGVVPITGPGGLQQHYATTDRRSSGSRMIL